MRKHRESILKSLHLEKALIECFRSLQLFLTVSQQNIPNQK